MVVKEGRFGPYVTDGETNASLRKGDTPESLTDERASDLLAERRARGPAPKKTAAKKAAPAEEGAGQEGRGQEGPGEEGRRQEGLTDRTCPLPRSNRSPGRFERTVRRGISGRHDAGADSSGRDGSARSLDA